MRRVDHLTKPDVEGGGQFGVQIYVITNETL